MADKNVLIMLEAIRLEIRAAAEAIACGAADVSDNLGEILRKRSDTLSAQGFTGVSLTAAEKDALYLREMR